MGSYKTIVCTKRGNIYNIKKNLSASFRSCRQYKPFVKQNKAMFIKQGPCQAPNKQRNKHISSQSSLIRPCLVLSPDNYLLLERDLREKDPGRAVEDPPCDDSLLCARVLFQARVSLPKSARYIYMHTHSAFLPLLTNKYVCSHTC